MSFLRQAAFAATLVGTTIAPAKVDVQVTPNHAGALTVLGGGGAKEPSCPDRSKDLTPELKAVRTGLEAILQNPQLTKAEVLAAIGEVVDDIDKLQQ